MPPDTNIWLVIFCLGVGTFLVRFSFIGIIGDRDLPEWVLRHLRYVAVAVMPGLVAPLVLWPDATGGTPEASRLAAAGAALLAGVLTRSPLWSIVAGFGTLLLYPLIF
ncbi:AzlD domain-containing protein [Oceanomicrobium pacificus]|uniref:AzlD domain-containing protein n=1 Tax=Oceanomicrobium pacificus TaxID=2692916 RepID=A0A6B0TJH5_9RHOB|nr:AzlD domain-containing protein [Oceanomicrobium pacificus]MXU64016.1 AzlD domain-containing protein [Oceanomicrobium pacificus]